MPEFSVLQWCLMIIAAAGIGISKSGLSGISMVHVLVFAAVFGARDSTGVVLPMLIFGDICAIRAYGQHANWNQVWRMMPPAIIGVIAAWLWMQSLDETIYKPLIGSIILGLTILQIVRLWRSDFQSKIPHAVWFAWMMGLTVGMTTMLANAAGPVFGLYLLALMIPKLEFVGTSAWFFLMLNAFKVPFSWQLGLIDLESLQLNALLCPIIIGGLFFGKAIVKRLPQKTFDSLILAFTAIAAMRLLFG
ncbi:MAG: sulfite exporter TauE/SafE family protein [Pirellulaceae bacterium]|nr:sulfite exporter TauE/SafE family protein [Pirellulaceae bacterium]